MSPLRTAYVQILLIMSPLAILTRRWIESHLALKKDISSVTVPQYVGCSDKNFLVYYHQWLTIIQFRGLNPIPELTIYLWKIYVYRASFQLRANQEECRLNLLLIVPVFPRPIGAWNTSWIHHLGPVHLRNCIFLVSLELTQMKK